jgi:hypothetical protein
MNLNPGGKIHMLAHKISFFGNQNFKISIFFLVFRGQNPHFELFLNHFLPWWQPQFFHLRGFRSLEKVIGRCDLLRPRAEGALRRNVPQPALASQPKATAGRRPKKLAKTLGLSKSLTLWYFLTVCYGKWMKMVIDS